MRDAVGAKRHHELATTGPTEASKTSIRAKERKRTKEKEEGRGRYSSLPLLRQAKCKFWGREKEVVVVMEDGRLGRRWSRECVAEASRLIEG